MNKQTELHADTKVHLSSVDDIEALMRKRRRPRAQTAFWEVTLEILAAGSAEDIALPEPLGHPSGVDPQSLAEWLQCEIEDWVGCDNAHLDVSLDDIAEEVADAIEARAA